MVHMALQVEEHDLKSLSVIRVSWYESERVNDTTNVAHRFKTVVEVLNTGVIFAIRRVTRERAMRKPKEQTISIADIGPFVREADVRKRSQK